MTHLITSHINADADSFGSMVGASILYPDSVLLWPGSSNTILENYVKQIQRNGNVPSLIFDLGKADLSQITTIVLVDVRSMGRVKHISNLLEEGNKQVIIYDHHPPTDDDVPSEKFIHVLCGAASSLLVEEIKKAGKTITPQEATWIGMGIYEDTGSFNYQTTQTYDFCAASWLKDNGMNIQDINDYMHKHSDRSSDLTLEELAAYEELAKNVNIYKINDKEITVTSYSSEHELRNFSGVVQKFKEDKEIKIMFALGNFGKGVVIVGRATDTSDYGFDVGEICRSFGGGGHRQAASARVLDSTLAEVNEKLYAAVVSYLEPHFSIISLMTVPAIVIESDKNIKEASAIIRNFNLKRAPIVNPDTQIVIGIADRVTLEKSLSHGLGDHSVQEFMDTNFTTMHIKEKSTSLLDTVLLMNQKLVPITNDEKKVVGVITRADVIHQLMKEPSRVPTMVKGKKSISLKRFAEKRLPKDIYKLLVQFGQVADELNYGVYAVGGFVRDLIMDKPNDDIDLVIEGDGTIYADKVNEIYGSGKVRHHQQFKTAVVTLKTGLKIDVTTARVEYYPEPVSLPVVSLSSLKMDLYRRDFTINAMAMQLNTKNFGILHDFFNGYRDIEEGRISVLHSLSFVEDPTRIMRAVRFEQRYKYKLCVQTKRLLRSTLKMGYFNKLSGTRLFNEIEKVFEEKNPVNCLERIEKSFKVLSNIHPAFARIKLDFLKEGIQVKEVFEIAKIPDKISIWKYYFMLITHDFSEVELREVMQRLLIPEGTIAIMCEEQKKIKRLPKKIRPLIKEESTSDLYFELKNLSTEATMCLMTLLTEPNERQFMTHYITNLKHLKLEITGHELKKLGIPAGPKYKTILEYVLRAKLDGKLGDFDSQLEFAKSLWESGSYE